MQTIAPLTLTDGVPITVPLVQGTTGVLIANESPFAINVELIGGTRWLPAWTMDYIPLKSMQTSSGQLQITPQNISSASNSPSSMALVTLYTQNETVNGIYPCSLTRQTNIGNGAIPTTATNSLINDGNAPGTQIVETTPLGQITPAFLLDNSGNLTLRSLVSSVWSVVLQVVSNGAAIFHGTSDNVPASGVTAGFMPTTVEIGTSATEKISFHDLNGGGQVGIISATKSVWLASGTNTGLLYNADFDGANYKFLATGDNAAQCLLSKDALGGTVPRWNIRYSTTVGTAGGTITWGAWQLMPQMLNNNTTGGTHIYTGTATPSVAVLGDLWFNA